MAEKTITIETTIAALVESKKYATLRDILVTMNPVDVAAVFEELPQSALPLLFPLPAGLPGLGFLLGTVGDSVGQFIEE